MKKVIGVILLFWCLIFCQSNIQADDGVFSGYGADVIPIEDNLVKMERELLTISYQPRISNTAKVEAIFVFKNNGESKTVLVGFPEALGASPDAEGNPTIFNFQTEVDGRSVGVIYQPLKKHNEELAFDRVYLWKVFFNKNETHIVKNTYAYYPSYSSNGEWRLSYILKTGALWADKIGQIDIVVNSRVPVPWMEFIPYPEEYSYFHAVNWEPDRDIMLMSYSQIEAVLYSKGKPVESYFSEASAKDFYQKNARERQSLIRTYIGKLSPERLATFNKNELQTYINGIYATYGRSFNDPLWAQFFDLKWWYQPNPAFKEQLLTTEDQKVIARLKTYLVNALESKEQPADKI